MPVTNWYERNARSRRIVRAILAYVALSQGRLYNPRLCEMLEELMAVLEGA